MALDKDGLLDLIATDFPDNTTGDISPADLRTVTSQIVTSAANLEELTVQDFLGPVTFDGSKVNILNRRVINEYADFPDPLLPDTQYYIGSAITLPTTLPASWTNMPNNIEFTGTAIASKLTWNGTGTLFGGSDVVGFRCFTILISAPNAKLFDFQQVSVTTTVNVIGCRILACDEIGVFNVANFFYNTTQCFNANKGITTGAMSTIANINSSTTITTDPAFIFCDISLSTFNTFDFVSLRVNGPSGAIWLKGLPGNVNITSGQRATISSSQLTGAITPLSGITEDDIRFNFTGNSGVRDSNPDAIITLTANATATVISASSTDGSNSVLVAGTWVEKNASQYATTAAGKVSALYETDMPSPITAMLTLEPVSGTNKDIAAYIVIDGVVDVSSRAGPIRVDSNNQQQLTLVWQESQSSLLNTDVEIHVENVTDSTNILVSGAVLRIR